MGGVGDCGEARGGGGGGGSPQHDGSTHFEILRLRHTEPDKETQMGLDPFAGAFHSMELRRLCKMSAETAG